MTIAATRAYEVVLRYRIKMRLVAQNRKSYKACFDQTCQIEIGKEMAAQKSLSMVIMKLGSRCMVTAVLYDLRWAASPRLRRGGHPLICSQLAGARLPWASTGRV